ncbi:hypothetical protein D9V37_07210 [Nocardioides mangrovicus]|uniref:Uncharacterized protein n=1 Tax=Nocardioides mangrovicus TaxID=2478913 RepID=A0A3L8P3U4_9ACTN|nr:hypothetical protein D9V37_07210 [Nocardioides mangrovicus]
MVSWLRPALLLVAVAMVVAACGGSPSPGPSPTPSGGPSSSGSSTATASPSSSPSTSPSTSGSPTAAPAACTGVRYAQVLGQAPAYGPGRLRHYPVDAFACAAYWLAQSDDLFVPQSLAVDESAGVAYVGGYRWARTYGPRPCQIAVVDLATGAVRAFQSKFWASIYHTAPTYCRHGGGMQLVSSGDGAGLWVQETQRLWVLDPSALGGTPAAPVKRWWRMGAGLRGSAMVVQGDRVGVASFSPRYRGRIYWFAMSDLLRSGVTDLTLGRASASAVRPVASGRVPRLLQGIAVGPGGLWYSTSGGGCAQLIGPDGHRYDFVPGSEGLQFAGDSLYVTSESGARPYIRGTSKKNVPVLVRLLTAKVLATSPSCRQ